jgi:hypothetical protein
MDILSLRRNVALVTKNAPDFIVEEALIDATQQLCMESEVWQAMVEVDVSKNDNEMMISPPTGASIVRVMWVTLGSRKLGAVDHATYATAFTNPSTSSPQYYYQVDSTNLIVYPTPYEDEIGQARIVCRLRDGTTEFPSDLFSLYREAIVFGALSRVLATPGDFGNPSMANAYEQRWLAALSHAKGRATRSKDNNVMVTTYGGY